MPPRLDPGQRRQRRGLGQALYELAGQAAFAVEGRAQFSYVDGSVGRQLCFLEPREKIEAPRIDGAVMLQACQKGLLPRAVLGAGARHMRLFIPFKRRRDGLQEDVFARQPDKFFVSFLDVNHAIAIPKGERA